MDADDGKDPWTIGQGVMVNSSADDADNMVDNKPTGLPEQGQEMEQGKEMSMHTPQSELQAPTPRPQTLDAP
jgi:hypothetical protein